MTLWTLWKDKQLDFKKLQLAFPAQGSSSVFSQPQQLLVQPLPIPAAHRGCSQLFPASCVHVNHQQQKYRMATDEWGKVVCWRMLYLVIATCAWLCEEPNFHCSCLQVSRSYEHLWNCSFDRQTSKFQIRHAKARILKSTEVSVSQRQSHSSKHYIERSFRALCLTVYTGNTFSDQKLTEKVCCVKC